MAKKKNAPSKTVPEPMPEPVASPSVSEEISMDQELDDPMMEFPPGTSLEFLKIRALKQGAQGLIDPPAGATAIIRQGVLVSGSNAVLYCRPAGAQLPPTAIAVFSQEAPNVTFDISLEGPHIFSVEGDGEVNLAGSWEYMCGVMPEDMSVSQFLNTCVVVQTPVEEETPMKETKPKPAPKSSLGSELKSKQQASGLTESKTSPKKDFKLSEKPEAKSTTAKVAEVQQAKSAKKESKKDETKEGEKGYRGEIRGVTYEVLVQGKMNRDPVQVNRKVRCRYAGKLKKNGKQFDKGSLSFRVGAGEMIPGFDAGVRGMRLNETRRMLIPARLGYGNQRQGPIPANSDLVFDVTILEIQ